MRLSIFCLRCLLRWVLASLLSLLQSVFRPLIYRPLLFSLALSLSLLLLNISSVKAEGLDTPTPPPATPTFRPFFEDAITPTPMNSCPGVQPVGAGTVTPSADWHFYCAQCLTPFVSTVAPIATPSPQATYSGKNSFRIYGRPGAVSPFDTNNTQE